ncbi:MAG: NfeD family protein [Bordetella sp.]|uniref:NfeD family protein n=1 Tax=Bordetella sp. TaxID=28081 RepID=UPI003F7CBDA6
MWTWFGLAVLALIGELVTGTFYLLLIAVGLAAAGVSAWLASPVEWQLVAFGVVTLAGLVVLRKTGVLKKREVDAQRNADVNLDIGQQVEVAAWKADGTAQVMYRGAAWQVELTQDETPQPGIYIIAAVRGSRLVLTRRRG